MKNATAYQRMRLRVCNPIAVSFSSCSAILITRFVILSVIVKGGLYIKNVSSKCKDKKKTSNFKLKTSNYLLFLQNNFEF